jgi:inorganic pyrophosphatase
MELRSATTGEPSSIATILFPYQTQTWSDPGQTHPDTGGKGDNDPIDVLEIGEQVAFVGQVKQIKPLGILALLNDGIIDFKLLAVDIQDPSASELNDVDVSTRNVSNFSSHLAWAHRTSTASFRV